MLVLALFAFVAGAGTAVSPCVLPVLPALLSAGATGGRRRPLGIVAGLAVTFTLTIVGLAELVDGVGLGNSFTRDIAIVALIAFGAAVALPALGDRLEAPLSRLARFGPQRLGDGFASGLGVGAALGFVYAPCAGPILAAVIAVSAASDNTVLIGAAYALGSALVLLMLALGGRGVIGRLRSGRRGPRLQQALGAVMVLTAIAMAFQLDVRFQTAIASHLPAVVVNPTNSLEQSGAVERRLADLRGPGRFAAATDGDAAAATASKRAQPAAGDDAALPGVETPDLPNLGAAPDFTGNERWFNTPGGEALSLRSQLRGRVVLVDFWTYTCINCIRTLPYVTAWDRKYRDSGLTVVGVHTPEFAFERDAGNVAKAVAQNHIGYPVAQDNARATWDAWGNQYWPAKYLIDADGQVRYAHFGEGDYDKTEAAIRALLAERGDRELGGAAAVRGAVGDVTTQTTPETYLGAARAERFDPAAPVVGRRTYAGVDASRLGLSHFALSGTWNVDAERATAIRDASLTARVRARRVYLVLSPAPAGRPSDVRVTVDGRAGRTVDVDGQRLYTLADLPRAGEHELRLDVDPGVSGFAFTFG